VLFNVSQLMREPVGSRRQYTVQEVFAPIEDDPAAVDLAGQVELLRTDRGVLVRARLTSTGRGECARCLRPVTYPVALEIEEEFMPSIDAVTGASLAPPDDPDVPTIDEHHLLDLDESARQSWLLAASMRVLCSPACAGLCPTCGADRNAGPCACDQAPADDRWAALAALRRLDAPRRIEEN